MSLQEEFHKLEYEIELQHFQSIVRKKWGLKDAKMNQNATMSLTVLGKATKKSSELSLVMEKSLLK